MNSAENMPLEIFARPYRPVLSTSAYTKKTVPNDNLSILISDIIFQLGIPVHTKGYLYLREAINLKLQDPQGDMPVTKILYPCVAKKFNTSAVGVERVIRHAIKVAWVNAEQPHRDNIIYRLFRFNKKPTNSQFIAIIAEHIALMYNLH